MRQRPSRRIEGGKDSLCGGRNGRIIRRTVARGADCTRARERPLGASSLPQQIASQTGPAEPSRQLQCGSAGRLGLSGHAPQQPPADVQWRQMHPESLGTHPSREPQCIRVDRKNAQLHGPVPASGRTSGGAGRGVPRMPKRYGSHRTAHRSRPVRRRRRPNGRLHLRLGVSLDLWLGLRLEFRRERRTRGRHRNRRRRGLRGGCVPGRRRRRGTLRTGGGHGQALRSGASTRPERQRVGLHRGCGDRGASRRRARSLRPRRSSQQLGNQQHDQRHENDGARQSLFHGAQYTPSHCSAGPTV